MGLHFYIECPSDGPGRLTTSRDNELAKIENRNGIPSSRTSKEDIGASPRFYYIRYVQDVNIVERTKIL
jgi:hypothetical protein